MLTESMLSFIRKKKKGHLIIVRESEVLTLFTQLIIFYLLLNLISEHSLVHS